MNSHTLVVFVYFLIFRNFLIVQNIYISIAIAVTVLSNHVVYRQEYV